jgi:hypothetical protein
LALGAVLFTRGNPNIITLSQLLQLHSVYDVRLALRGCLSILLVPEDDYDYIRPYHASLQDFLTDSNRGRGWFLDPVICNGSIVDGCIQLITSNSTSDDASLHYACWNWSHHLHLAVSYAQDLDYIQSYLGLRVEQLLNFFSQQIDAWFCGLKNPYGVIRVHKDLNYSLTCAMVRVSLDPCYHLECILINQTQKQQAQLLSLTQTLQQACATIDVSIGIVIVEIKHCFSCFPSLLESRFCCCQCIAVLMGLHVDWSLVCMLMGLWMLQCLTDGCWCYLLSL